MQTTIAVDADLPARPDSLFRFLADLDNHRRLVDGRLEIVELDGPPGRRTGGRVEMHGPLGIHRTASTRVEHAERDRELSGTASVSEATSARLIWTLSPRERGTSVRLAVEVKAGTLRDRALLALGGRAWLRRRFAEALRRLAAATA